MSELRVFLLNANSLVSHERRSYLKEFLDDNRPDILLITETKLSSRHVVSFQGYNLIRTDRISSSPNPGGGTSILIKNNLVFKEIPCRDLTSLEITIIELELDSGRKIVLCSVYHSRKLAPKISRIDLDKILAIMNGRPFIIGGDFNAKHELWSNSKKCPNGELLYDWYTTNFNCDDFSIEFTREPTRKGLHNSSFLDIFFVSNRLKIHYPNPDNLLDVVDGISDHVGVKMIVDLNSKVSKKAPILSPNFGKTNWNRFNHYLNEKMSALDIPEDRNMTISELDNVSHQLNDVLKDTIENCVPKISHRPDQFQLDETTLKLIKCRKTFRRNYYRHIGDPSAPLLKSIIKNVENIIKQRISNCRQKLFAKKLRDIKLDNNTFSSVRKILGPKSANIPTLDENGRLYSTNLERANLIGEQFQQNHTISSTIGNIADQNSISQDINLEFSNHAPLTVFSSTNSALRADNSEPNPHNLISTETIMSIIASKKNRKAPGLDNCTNFVLKNLTSTFYEKLTIFINQLFNAGHFPKGWKHALIVPIHKPGKDPTKALSYRPISLLTAPSKIYEIHVSELIKEFNNVNNLIPSTQFGFRNRHGTNHALLKLQTDIIISNQQKKPTVAVSLDVEKAFDTTWPEGLVYKMKNCGFSTTICSIVLSFMKSRTFQVKILDCLSNTYNISAGVPQGSVLGPILFTIYTHDIPKPSDHRLRQLSYADDHLVYASSFSSRITRDLINTHLQKLSIYYEKWKIKVNDSKTTAILFQNRCTNSFNSTDINIVHNNIPVPIQTEIKYLGLVLNGKLGFQKHFNHSIKKSLIVSKKLNRVLYPTDLTRKVKLLLYKQLIRPVLTYASPIWNQVSSSQMERLRKIERKILRNCLDKRRTQENYKHTRNSVLYKEAAMPRIDAFLTKLNLKFFENCKEHENSVVKDCANVGYTTRPSRRLNPPVELLNATGLYDTESRLIYYNTVEGSSILSKYSLDQ